MTKCKETNTQPEVPTICLDGLSIRQLAKRLNLSLPATRKLISSLTEYKASLSEQAEALRPIAEQYEDRRFTRQQIAEIFRVPIKYL